MTLQTMRYFQTLANYRSFSKAAASLFISQSALSHSIQTLEQELGVALIQRQSREHFLTEHGRHFLAQTQEIFLNLDHLHAELDNKETQAAKPLRITVKIGLYPLASMLQELRDQYHSIRLEIHQADQTRMPFVSWDFSFLCREEYMDQPYQKLLFDEPFCAAFHREHPLADKKELTFEALKPYPAIQMLLHDYLQNKLEGIYRETDFHPDYFMTTDHYLFVLRLLRKNQGWSILPAVSLFPSNDPNLVLRPIRELPLRRYIYLARNPANFFSQSMQTFQTYTLSYFRRYRMLRGDAV